MIYFIAYLFVEVMLTTQFASFFGGFAMFGEIVLSAFIGIIILFNFRTTLVLNIMELKERRVDTNGFYRRNLLSLLGAILLILPGVLTDVIGLSLQVYLLGSLIVSQFMPKYPNNTTFQAKTHTKGNDDVIDAEIIHDTPALH
jgi:UPF0716 family protein affecting phage T7 exclusion